MAISLGPSTDNNDPEPMMEINTTPLIDVMLVLLILLIITIPIQLHAVNLNMPQGAPPIESPQAIKVDIDAQGKIFWNGEAVLDKPTLEQRLLDAARQATQPEIHLRPNKLAPYREVAMVMAAAQRAGVTKLGLVGGEGERR